MTPSLIPVLLLVHWSRCPGPVRVPADALVCDVTGAVCTPSPPQSLAQQTSFLSRRAKQRHRRSAAPVPRLRLRSRGGDGGKGGATCGGAGMSCHWFLGPVPRRLPVVICMADLRCCRLQGTGFCSTYGQFLACRALFGIAMGGLYGNAAATALEDLPEEARGLMSGILQQGYAFGYLLATAFARALVNTTPHGWRPFFWFGACPPVLVGLPGASLRALRRVCGRGVH